MSIHHHKKIFINNQIFIVIVFPVFQQQLLYKIVKYQWAMTTEVKSKTMSFVNIKKKVYANRHSRSAAIMTPDFKKTVWRKTRL